MHSVRGSGAIGKQRRCLALSMPLSFRNGAVVSVLLCRGLPQKGPLPEMPSLWERAAAPLCNDSAPPLARYLDNLEVLESTVADGEADEGAHLVPALQARGAGVDVEQAQLLVVLHPEDMAVPADEEAGRAGIDLLADAGGVAAGVAPNVRHQHLGTLAVPAKLDGEHASQVASVAIAADGPQRAELLEALGQLERTDVAGVPNLVARLEVLQVAVVPITVGVAQQAYPFHP